MVTRLRKVRGLSADERWLLAQMLVLLSLTLAGIYMLGISRWQTVLARLTGRRRKSGSDAHSVNGSLSKVSISLRDEDATSQRARAIARLMRIAASHGLYRASCLHQSLVLWSLLRRNGIASEIRFGARKEEGELEAHAWVECHGIALNEEGDLRRRFAPFEKLVATTIN